MNAPHVGAGARRGPRPGAGLSRQRARRRFCAALATADLAALLIGFLLPHLVYPSGRGLWSWVEICAIMAPVYLVFALNADAYSTHLLSQGGGISRAMRALVSALGVVFLVGFFAKTSAQYSRGILSIGWVVSLLLLALLRDQVLRHAKRLLGGRPEETVMIVDGSAPGLASGPAPQVAGVTALTVADWFDPDSDSPEGYDMLARHLKDVERVIVACPAERRQSWARALKGASVRSEFWAPELEGMAPLGIGHCAGQPTLIVSDGPLLPFDAAVKRAFDVLVSGAALVLLAPLFAILAILIKRESDGPVFFVQTRIGRGNAQFRMLKFRSMRADASDHSGHASTDREDRRVTPIGAIIRKTSIDELPQLINVLKGDMSIVGPRPHALGSRAANKLFWEVDGRYFHRHAAKPGLTGLAQIRGYRGATMSERDLTDRLQSDLEYLSHWTIWRDFKIIARTFTVLIHRNAF